MQRGYQNRQQGFAVAEVLFAIVLLSVITPLVYRAMEQAVTAQEQSVAAQQAKMISKAVGYYIKANHAALESSSTANSSTEITVANLVADGYLPAGTSSTNIWGQNIRIFVLEPSANNLQAVIATYNGMGYNPAIESTHEFSNITIPGVANMIGATGGFISTGTLTGLPTNTLIGTGKGWLFPFAGTDIPVPTPGHYGVLNYYQNGALVSDYLYRTEVPGRPELNTMFTDLTVNGSINATGDISGANINASGDVSASSVTVTGGITGNTLNLTGNAAVGGKLSVQGQIDTNGKTLLAGNGELGGGDTEGVGIINFEHRGTASVSCAAGDNTGGRLFYNDSQGLYICRGGVLRQVLDEGNSSPIESAGIGGHGTWVPKPSCTTGKAPRIYGAITAASKASSSNIKLLAEISAWAESYANGWSLRLRIITDVGMSNPASPYGKILYFTRCE